MWIRKISSSPISMTGSSGLPLERVRVLVEDLRAEEHQQVAGDVDDQIDEQREPGDADEELHPDRGGEDARCVMTINMSSLLLRRETRAS